jgi:hypothetical protein
MIDMDGPLSYFRISLIEKVYIGARGQTCNCYGLAISLAYPIGGEGSNFTCSIAFYLPSRRLEGGGG